MPKSNYWTEDRISLFKKIYTDWRSGKKELLSAFPEKTYNNLKQYASRHKIRKYSSTLKPLLNDTPQCYYWIGFICADGHFTKKGQLVIKLQKRDENHLAKLARLLSTHIRDAKHNGLGKNTVHCIMTTMDGTLGHEICKKFNLANNKTYKPPKIQIFKNWSDELFIAWFIGFIDGDGWVYKNKKRKNIYTIGLKHHCKWYNVHKYIRKRLQAIYNVSIPKIRITKDGYSFIRFSNTNLIQSFINFIELNELDHLERKWNKVKF